MPIAGEKPTNRFFVMITTDEMPRQHVVNNNMYFLIFIKY